MLDEASKTLPHSNHVFAFSANDEHTLLPGNLFSSLEDLFLEEWVNVAYMFDR